MPRFALAALAIYLFLACLTCFSREAGRCTPKPRLEIALLTIGLLLHGIAVFAPFSDNAALKFGAAEALSLTAWLALALYLAGRLVWQLQAPLLMPLTLATGLLLLALLLPQSPPLDYSLTPLARGHLLIAMLAYGMLTNAAAIALLMRIADRRLHHPRASMLQRAIPPLLTLEHLLFLCLWFGFALLTLALLSGLMFAEQAWGQPLAFNHKTLFSIVAWLIFGTLLTGRLLRGWRGRFAANWALSGYVLLLLGYMGAQFIMTFLLHHV